MTRQSVHNIVSGKTAITPETAVRLEQLFPVSAERWLALQSAFDLYKVRTVGSPGKISFSEQAELEFEFMKDRYTRGGMRDT